MNECAAKFDRWNCFFDIFFVGQVKSKRRDRPLFSLQADAEIDGGIGIALGDGVIGTLISGENWKIDTKGQYCLSAPDFSVTIIQEGEGCKPGYR